MRPEELPSHPLTWPTLLAQLATAGGVAFGLYAATVSLLITPYVNQGSDAGRVLGVYEGYQRVRDRADRLPVVLFWGSSMIREGVDCTLLGTEAPELASYNFSVSGDIPYRRMVELPRVTELHPECVVIGVSYPEVFESRAPFDDQVAVLPPDAYQKLSAPARGLLEAKVSAVIERSGWERLWQQRKHFFSAACWKLGVPDRTNPIPPGYTTNLKTPFVYTHSTPAPDLVKFLDSRANDYPPYTSSLVTDPASGLSGRSLKVIVDELVRQGIAVKLMNMPLHPCLTAAISDGRRTILQNYLKTLMSPSAQVFDYQTVLPADCFTDLVHLNAKGRAAFTGMMAAQLRPALAQASEKGFHEL